MASGWTIKTFDRARWDLVFGGGSAEAEQKMLDAMLWHHDGYFDDDADELRPGPNREKILSTPEGRQSTGLARHLAHTGFTYEGLDGPQASRLDDFGAHLGGSDELANELDMQWHSPDFYHQSFAVELLDRAGANQSWWSRFALGRRQHGSVKYLPFLLTGRRFGTDAEPTRGDACYYVILSPAEVVALRREATLAMDVVAPWRDKWGRPTTEDYLLAPLDEVIESGRWVLMTLAY